MKMDSKSKTPKYWYQRTGHGMRNDRTLRPASDLKRKPCYSNYQWLCFFLVASLLSSSKGHQRRSCYTHGCNVGYWSCRFVDVLILFHSVHWHDFCRLQNCYLVDFHWVFTPFPAFLSSFYSSHGHQGFIGEWIVLAVIALKDLKVYPSCDSVR